MKRLFLCCSLILFISLSGYSQKSDTLSSEQVKSILSQLNLDTTKFLREAAIPACKCIDSINIRNKDQKEISEDISKCIDKQVATYQISMGIYHSMKNPKSGNKIDILVNTEKSSEEYRRNYYRIETWLRDSCRSLFIAVNSHNKSTKNSESNNAEARQQYNTGIEWLKKDSLRKALYWFELAVFTDPKFAFAWDNIGICNRRLGNLEEALKAYNKSLEYDPAGVTPLHNIPVVYEFQKEYQKAIKAYELLLEKYPDDVEGYYGQGRVYAYFVGDMEKGLRNMCQAYNLYIKMSSPYRVDAEKNINYIYGKMKADGKEKLFFDILKEYKISAGN